MVRHSGVVALLAVTLATVLASPADATLVYQRPTTKEIVVAHNDGSSPRVVERGSFPVVSPDGRRVVFVAAGRHRSGDIRVVSVQGGHSLKVLGHGAAPLARAGVWSPDSRRLVVGGKDGTLVRVLDVGCYCGRRIDLDETFTFAGAQFSPDSSRVVVERFDVNAEPELLSLRFPRGHLRSEPGSELPVWGPGGLATRGGDANKYEPGTYTSILVAARLGGQAREVLRGRPDEFLRGPVAWSRDGKLLVEASSEASSTTVPDGVSTALILDPATGSRQTLPTPFNGGGRYGGSIAAISQDGRLVLGEAGGDVVAEDLNGQVTVLASDATTPTWTR